MADNSLSHPESRSEIRKSKRRLRDQLSTKELLHAQWRLATIAKTFAPLRNAKRVLSYNPLGGEISPQSLEASLAHAQLYQPRITHFAKGLMRFYSANAPKTRNQYGIYEPAAIGSPIPSRYFDAALVPLVAFDRRGNRLGMGAGFYDRAMAIRLSSPTSKRPLLVGLAHHFQEVNSLEAQTWDVPLDVILTDQELIEIKRP